MAARYSLIPGQCELIEHFIDIATADNLFKQIYAAADWRRQTITLFGKSVISPRLCAWYGDKQAVYGYSGTRNIPLPWFDALLDARALIQARTGWHFNSVLLNLYRHGADSMGIHSDNEPELGRYPRIAALSLGTTRRFILHSRHGRPNLKIDLTHGSLLLMSGRSQLDWRHSVPKTKRLVKPRINMTFRMVNERAEYY